jgi:hypothetical protein
VACDARNARHTIWRGRLWRGKLSRQTNTLFAWLISHQPAVLFSQNKPAINNQPAVLFSQNKPATSQTNRLQTAMQSFNGVSYPFYIFSVLTHFSMIENINIAFTSPILLALFFKYNFLYERSTKSY